MQFYYYNEFAKLISMCICVVHLLLTLFPTMFCIHLI